MLPLRPALHLSLIAAALIAANLTHADVPASAPFTPEQQQLIQQLSASEVHRLTPQIASAAALSAAKSIQGEKQAIDMAKDALEVGRKSVDWWLSNISVWLAAFGILIALASFGIPYAMGKKRQLELEGELNEVRNQFSDAKLQLTEVKKIQENALSHLQNIEKIAKQAKEKESLIPDADQISGSISKEVIEKIQNNEGKNVAHLVERAMNETKKNSWKEAAYLWRLLTFIQPEEPSVWINYAKCLFNMELYDEAIEALLTGKPIGGKQSRAINNNLGKTWLIKAKKQEVKSREFWSYIRIAKDYIEEALRISKQSEGKSDILYKNYCEVISYYIFNPENEREVDLKINSAKKVVDKISNESKGFVCFVNAIYALRANDFESARMLLSEALDNYYCETVALDDVRFESVRGEQDFEEMLLKLEKPNLL